MLRSFLACTTALSFFVTAPAAVADVTGADVWADWRGYMEGFGYSITANETTSGNTLSVADIAMSLPMPGTNDTAEYRIPQIDFTTRSDGTVAVIIAPEIDLSMNMALQTGEAIDLALSYDTENFKMIVAGDPSALKYTYSADSAQITLDELVVDGTAVPSETGMMTVMVSKIAGTTDLTVTDVRTYNQTMTTGPMTYEVSFSNPTGGGEGFELKGGSQGLNYAGTGDIPKEGDFLEMSALLAAGFEFTGTFGFLAGNMDMNFSGPDGAGTATTTSQGGNLALAMDAKGITYDVTQNGLDVNMFMPNVPLPVSFKMQESKFNLSMPLQKSDEEQDFAFGFKMGDFTMSDMIWGIFDPTQQLPRDPATLALDLTGKVKVLIDFFDPEQAAAMETGEVTPGELNAVTLQNLVVDMVGARLTGAGDFTFDNSETGDFGGMPKPTGAVDLQLVGGNGLIDKLVAMGMLPDQQAMGARMMMNLFAVVGEGEDTLTSKIEFNEEGHILANGQRIQ